MNDITEKNYISNHNYYNCIALSLTKNMIL